MAKARRHQGWIAPRSNSATRVLFEKPPVSPAAGGLKGKIASCGCEMGAEVGAATVASDSAVAKRGTFVPVAEKASIVSEDNAGGGPNRVCKRECQQGNWHLKCALLRQRR